MNLGDPELELIDPTPNVHNLFIQFDKLFFWAKLASRVVVRWSKRMYSCAGVCSYEGRGGLCDIALSEPLLKLRPRKNLVETLLHEMIHAFLFVTCRDNDRDGHGPNFQAHMYRINRSAGINITIYHDFHDEVKLYQTHVWRCNGPCQQRRPHFGIVRRPMNKVPGPSDYWWENHKRYCGGQFIKIKEPEKKGKQPPKKAPPPKPKADITKYINTGNKTQNVPAKPVLKDSNTMPVKTKSNGGNTLVITKKGPVYNPQVEAKKSPVVFSGKGQLLADSRQRSNSVGVLETVRNVWANKQIPVNPAAVVKTPNELMNNTISANKTPKHKIESHKDSPPAKVAKIDDYFEKTASSVLKGIYGNDFQITQMKDKKIIAIDANVNKNLNKEPPGINIKDRKPSLSNKDPVTPLSTNHVSCPICNVKVSNSDINRHLDECLNKEVIEKLTKDTETIPTPSTSSHSKKELKEIVGALPEIPTFRGRSETTDNIINERIARSNSLVYPPTKDYVDLVKIQEELNTAIVDLEKDLNSDEDTNNFNPIDLKKVKTISKQINYDEIVKESDMSKREADNVDFGFLLLDDVAVKIETPSIKIEPGTSKDIPSQIGQKCACCGNQMDKPIEEHLDECLAFFENNNTIPEEGASTSFANETIVIDDDDDIFDESQVYNATGTKTPCPCCLDMVEEAEMKDHLDHCLSD